MAHYIVLVTGEEGTDRRVWGAAFSNVPGGNNDAGVPWVDVVRGYRRWSNRKYGGSLAAVAEVDATTQAALDAGTMFEWRWATSFPQTHTNPQAIAAIEAAINAQEAEMISKLSVELRYWGFEGDS
jgi:hypothetical protein